MTISAGVVDDAGRSDITPVELIRRADEKLYQAKNEGRNRVCSLTRLRRVTTLRVLRQSRSIQLRKIPFVDPAKLHAIAGAQRKISLLDIDQQQWRSADDVPAAWASFGVDAGLPAGQADAARFDAQPRRFQARHAGNSAGR